MHNIHWNFYNSIVNISFLSIYFPVNKRMNFPPNTQTWKQTSWIQTKIIFTDLLSSVTKISSISHTMKTLSFIKPLLKSLLVFPSPNHQQLALYTSIQFPQMPIRTIYGCLFALLSRYPLPFAFTHDDTFLPLRYSHNYHHTVVRAVIYAYKLLAGVLNRNTEFMLDTVDKTVLYTKKETVIIRQKTWEKPLRKATCYQDK